jgi:mono/diheme cytochrome c family protein
MKKVLAGSLFVFAGVAVLAAQQTPRVARAQAAPGTPAASTAVRQVAPAGAPVSAADAAKYRAWLNQNCVGCHNARVKQPPDDPVNLEMADTGDVLANAATWERVLRKLAVRAMPPQGSRHPSEPEYVAFTTWLSSSLDRAWAGKATPGRFVVHRLNRTEYGNAVRDLLALDVDVNQLLPSDGADFGFDNIAASLKTSPLLLERYLAAAQRVSLLAVGDTTVPPGNTEYPLSREFTQSGYIEGLPLGTHGGTVIRHIFPADGEYKLSGRLVRGVEEGYAGVEGNDLPHTFVITVDGAEVYSAQIGGLKDNEVQARDMNEARTIIDARMSGRVRLTAGQHDVGYTWRERPSERQDVWQPARRDSQEVHLITGLPRLKAVMVEGPYKVTGISPTPSREKIFICRPASAKGSGAAGAEAVPDESACASKILTSLARRAYRRPVTAADVEAPVKFYRQSREAGGNFDAGIRSGLARILASPSFLYRIERDPVGVRAGTGHAVSDVELASRLSFFLWSSIPDDKLLNLAVAGQLRQPGVLDAQVRRMVEDERVEALVSNFAGQWLQLRNLESKVSPDLLMFPDFDDNTRRGFRRETEMLFGSILRENHSVLELMNADYTFLNERLAKHYGIPGVYGERFRKVKLTDPNRYGLLGQGSILSLTAVATRTSPVYRGKYILSNLLDTPPIPPPPDVPTLEESNKTGQVKAKTLREQVESHRARQPCAGCHRTIDPPGFALEHFNSVGQWRDRDELGRPIDSAGVLADGTSVDGPIAMREAILKHPEAFATVLTTRLLTYALGRRLEPSDMPVVRKIVKNAARDDYRFASIISGIVDSPVFQMRTRLEPSDPTNTVAQAKEQ